jgi:hypothetical protein
MAGTVPQREPQSQGEPSESRQRSGPLTAAHAEGTGFLLVDRDARHSLVFSLAAALVFSTG